MLQTNKLISLAAEVLDPADAIELGKLLPEADTNFDASISDDELVEFIESKKWTDFVDAHGSSARYYDRFAAFALAAIDEPEIIAESAKAKRAQVFLHGSILDNLIFCENQLSQLPLWQSFSMRDDVAVRYHSYARLRDDLVKTLSNLEIKLMNNEIIFESEFQQLERLSAKTQKSWQELLIRISEQSIDDSASRALVDSLIAIASVGVMYFGSRSLARLGILAGASELVGGLGVSVAGHDYIIDSVITQNQNNQIDVIHSGSGIFSLDQDEVLTPAQLAEWSYQALTSSSPTTAREFLFFQLHVEAQKLEFSTEQFLNYVTDARSLLSRAEEDFASFTASHPVLFFDDEQAIDEMRQILFSQYDRDEYIRDETLVSAYLDGAAGNCELQSKILLALFLSGKIHLASGLEAGLQLYDDHIQPVLINHSTGEVLELLSGKIQLQAEAPVYNAKLYYSFYSQENPTTTGRSILPDHLLIMDAAKAPQPAGNPLFWETLRVAWENNSPFKIGGMSKGYRYSSGPIPKKAPLQYNQSYRQPANSVADENSASLELPQTVVHEISDSKHFRSVSYENRSSESPRDQAQVLMFNEAASGKNQVCFFRRDLFDAFMKLTTDEERILFLRNIEQKEMYDMFYQENKKTIEKFLSFDGDALDYVFYPEVLEYSFTHFGKENSSTPHLSYSVPLPEIPIDESRLYEPAWLEPYRKKIRSYSHELRQPESLRVFFSKLDDKNTNEAQKRTMMSRYEDFVYIMTYLKFDMPKPFFIDELLQDFRISVRMPETAPLKSKKKGANANAGEFEIIAELNFDEWPDSSTKDVMSTPSRHPFSSGLYQASAETIAVYLTPLASDEYFRSKAGENLAAAYIIMLKNGKNPSFEELEFLESYLKINLTDADGNMGQTTNNPTVYQLAKLVPNSGEARKFPLLQIIKDNITYKESTGSEFKEEVIILPQPSPASGEQIETEPGQKE